MSLHKPNSNERDLVQWLQSQEASAMNKSGDDVSQARSDAYGVYNGEPYGNEEDGFSKVVTREVMESIEWAMPGLLRVFLHSPYICSFTPLGEEDVDAARLETKACNHILKSQNNAWEVMNAWFRDTLMYPNGYSKIWYDDSQVFQNDIIRDLTEVQIGMLEKNPDVEIQQVELADSNKQDLYDVALTYIESSGRIKWAAVPPEEVLISPKANLINLDAAPWLAHHRPVTRGEALDMGYPESIVEQLPSYMEENNSESENREQYHDEDEEAAPDFLEEEVDWYEGYGYVDFNGDNHSEYRRMVHSGKFLLENIEIPSVAQPICALGTIPQSHRHMALSMYDLGADVQEINTVQTRQMLDNLYRTNRPRQFAGRGVNIDQLQSYAPFGVVEMSKPDDVVTEKIPSVITQILPAIESQRSNLEMRTGMSRMMQGMDADKLAKTTMGAYFEALGMANQRLEFIARCFAETGMKQVILKTHYLSRNNPGSIERSQLVGGQWIDVDPASWIKRSTMVAEVGLGTGTQRERISSSNAILEVQEKALQAGLTTKSRIFNTLEDLTMAMGKVSTNMYFLDPESEEAQKIEKDASEAKQKAEAQQQKNITDAIESQVAPAMAKIAAQSETDSAKLTMEFKKLQVKMEEMSDRHFEKMTELELSNNVDIEGEGISGNSPNVVGVDNAA